MLSLLISECADKLNTETHSFEYIEMISFSSCGNSMIQTK